MVVIMILALVILQLALQNRRGGVAVGSALFKTVVFLHRLVVQILAVHRTEKHFVEVVQLGSKLRRLEGGQRFAAAGGVPDVPAARHRAVLFIVVGEFQFGSECARWRRFDTAASPAAYFPP